VRRKEAEISSLNTKLESEQSLVAQLQKKIKELQVSAADWQFCHFLYSVVMNMQFAHHL